MQNNDKPYVLFADDDADSLTLITMFAAERGWRYDTATTATEILEQVNLHCKQQGDCYDVLVCDVNYFNSDHGSMPRLTGITAATEIRRQFPNLPILFVSAYDTYILKDQIKVLNAELITKPFDPDFLFKRMEFAIYWNKKSYTDQDRRSNKINVSGLYRRSTDRRLHVPDVLDKALKDVKESITQSAPPICAKRS